MAPVVVLLAGGGAPWESPVLAATQQRADVVVLRRCVDVDDLLAAAASGQAEVAVVGVDAPGLDLPAVERLRRAAVAVVAVVPEGLGAERARAHAERSGLRTVVPGHDPGAVIAAVLAAASARGEDAPRAAPSSARLVPGTQAGPQSGPHADTRAGTHAGAPDRGRVVAVWGPGGAPGRTTTAVALAACGAARGRRSVLLDVDPAGGTIAQHLGLLEEVSGLLAASRLEAAGGLDDGAAGLLRAVAPGWSVLTGLPRPDRWSEVRPGLVERLTDLLATQGDVYLDTGAGLEVDAVADLAGRPARDGTTLEALAVADEVVVVGAPDPVGLARLGRGLAALHEVLDGRPVRVVLNRVRASLGWPERDVLALVAAFDGVATVLTVPDDRAAADRALAAGRPVTDADTPLARALRAVWDDLALAPPPAAGGRRADAVRPRRAPRGARRRAQAAKSR